MSTQKPQDPLDRLVNAYDSMMEHLHGLLTKSGPHVVSFKEALAQARERVVELEELSREEAERISSYLERDMRDAATFVHETGQDFREWFRFDVKLMEERLLNMFVGVADQTSVQLRQWADRAREANSYHTGEITGPGTLICTGCGKEMHFRKPGHIPPCSGCKGTTFRRAG